MKDYNGKIQYRDKELTLVFDLNVIEAIQEEYGSLDAWGELTYNASDEPNIKAFIFGLTEMLNEGIEIHNDETGLFEPLFTHKQVGRIITEVGLENATQALHRTVIDSTDNDEKNA